MLVVLERPILMAINSIVVIGVKVTSVTELFVVAEAALGSFQQLMAEFVRNAGLDPDAMVMHKGSKRLQLSNPAVMG